jgi:hypothetical protein
MRCVGLTDDPETRRIALGKPADWIQYQFMDEGQARAWEKRVLKGPGFIGGREDEGWRYGYAFTMTTLDDK